MRIPNHGERTRKGIARGACGAGLGFVTLLTLATLNATPALAEDADSALAPSQNIAPSTTQVDEAEVQAEDTSTQNETAIVQEAEAPAQVEESAATETTATSEESAATETTATSEESAATETTATSEESTASQESESLEEEELTDKVSTDSAQTEGEGAETTVAESETTDGQADNADATQEAASSVATEEEGNATSSEKVTDEADATEEIEQDAATQEVDASATTDAAKSTAVATASTTEATSTNKQGTKTTSVITAQDIEETQTPRLIKIVKNGVTLYFYQDADGNRVTSSLVKVTHNTEGKELAASKQYWAYARPSGRLVTGSWSDGNVVYLAYSGGRLRKRNGWLNLSKKTYYMKSFAAQTGFFNVGSTLYYGTPDEGHIIKGVTKTSEGWLAANEKSGKIATSSFVKTDAITGSKELYWFGSDGKIVKDRFITPSADGSQYVAYARSDGRIVTGHWTNADGNVYVADKTGKLAKKSGWLVSNKYDSETQRYRMVNYAALTGFFKVGKSWYYGIADKGYVARGTTKTSDGWVIANAKSGKLSTSRWIVTDKFSGTQERYWFDASGQMARDRLITTKEGAGYYAYAKPDGAIARGVYFAGNGISYVADSTSGKLMGGKSGWIITGKYDNGTLRRYRYNAKVHGVKVKGFKVGNNLFYGIPSKGYVATGKVVLSDGVLLASSSGRLENVEGWLVTKKYDAENQRYYLKYDENHGVPLGQIGLFSVKSGKKTYKYYGHLEYGFVKRNCMVYSGTDVYKANNLGRLTSKGTMNDRQLAAYKVAQTKSSNTRWLITMERTSHVLYLWHKNGDAWEMEWDQLCSIGRRYGRLYSITPISESVVWEKRPWFSSTVWALGFNSRYHIHSVIVNRNVQVTDGRLGMNISSGCIRLPVPRAYDLYLKVPVGSHVSIYDVNGDFH